jgi:RNA polymerase sigma-70 factor (ECF subfamily)
MSTTNATEVTRLLAGWRAGDSSASDRLISIVYRELHLLAGRQLQRERQGHTLQTTALVHEAYLRLVGSEIPWSDRRHFFAVAARAMRRVLVDHARARAREKRGGNVDVVTLNDQIASASGDTMDVAALDEALERLGLFDDRKARVVELHFFGGLTYDETAETLEISAATVHRELRLAKAWLYRELRHDVADS